jgi:hypothetical protein
MAARTWGSRVNVAPLDFHCFFEITGKNSFNGTVRRVESMAPVENQGNAENPIHDAQVSVKILPRNTTRLVRLSWDM